MTPRSGKKPKPPAAKILTGEDFRIFFPWLTAKQFRETFLRKEKKWRPIVYERKTDDNL